MFDCLFEECNGPAMPHFRPSNTTTTTNRSWTVASQGSCFFFLQLLDRIFVQMNILIVMIFLGQSGSFPPDKEQFLLIYSFMKLDIITLQMKGHCLYIYARYLTYSFFSIFECH